MRSVSWWCSATGQAWTWEWRAYPGVWLFLLAIVLSYARIAWRGNTGRTPQARAGARRLLGAAGLALIWILLDWPVGTLGSGYLMAAHAAQFLMLSFIVPPLLYGGVPPHQWGRLEARLGDTAAFRVATHPLVTGIAFNLVAIVTHVPSVVDGLMGTQLGAFVIDLGWIAGGVAFWWPVLAPFPARAGGGLAKIGYLFASSMVHTGIGMWLLLARYPVYATYELAPPIGGRSVMSDQAMAGGIMELIGGMVVLSAIAAVFFSWAAEQDRESPLARNSIPVR
ncbi:MAG: cytochrome c oxidase assembly protein [Gemmatimonadales bacterium]